MNVIVKLRLSLGLCLLTLSLSFATTPLLASTPSGVSAPQTLSLASSDERPLSPWVFRSVLDDQPRMVTVALHEDLYIAFDARHAGIYKAWKGGVEFDGAVYTTKHGPQPTSEGYAYYQAQLDAPTWVIELAGKTTPVEVQFRGYRFVQGQVVFQYDLLLAGSRAIRVNETPEYRSKNRQTGLQRVFTLGDVPADIKVGMRMTFTSLQSEKDFATDGEFIEKSRTTVNHGNGSTLSVDGLLWLNTDKATDVSVFFHPGFTNIAQPTSAKDKALDDIARGKALIAASDCHTCHNEERKTIGPAYLEIAGSYNKSAATRTRLAEKIMKGGSGVWGNIPMNPHPDLTPTDADLMVRYILSLRNQEIDEAPLEALFLGVASQSLQIDDKPKPTGETEKRLKPGLAVATHYIESYVPEVFSQVAYSGETSILHVIDVEDLGPITTHVLMRFNGFIQTEKAGSYSVRLVTDDGGRMSINGEPVISRWQNQGPTAVEATVTLTEGLNSLAIEYYQAMAGGSISLQWRAPGAKGFSVIPTENLRHHQHQIAQPVPYIPRKELVKSIPGDKTPLDAVHPAFTLFAARPDWFKPIVGGMDFFSDGRLALCSWDAEGAVYILEGVHDHSPNDISVKRVASGLGECLGLHVVDEQIFALQKHELTHLIDTDGDGVIDEYRTISDQWRVSTNFHEFAFGLGYEDGYFYATLATAIEPGGASTNPQIPDRGKVIKISRKDGSVEFIARGLRTPNGIGKGVDGEYFIADNQGDWLPASKIVHVKPGAFYGSRSVDFASTEGVAETPPVVWLPQDEIGNSPSEPIYINVGDYKGQMLHGEVTHGGLKRVYAEKVNDAYQGAVFRFSQGLEAGVNRLVWAADGKNLFVGGVGNPGNWSHTGKNWFGLERLTFNGKQAFEMLKVSARTNGMELEFTQPLEPGRGITAQEYEVQQWYYLPTAEYGGDKLNLRDLTIRSVNLSKDRKKVFLELDGMKAGHVIYIRIAEPFVSTSGQSLWTTEAWYTLNAIPAKKPGFKGAVKPQPHNTLSAAERKQGWKLLFDGKTTKGWRGYKTPQTGSAWKVVDGTLHLDPTEKNGWQTVGGGDIITDKMYENYELAIEWKLAPGGNSGLIYGVVEKPEYDYVWHSGTEYQFLDNPAHPDGAIKTHRAGDLYDLISSCFVAVNAGGKWNRTRLVVRRGKVEHWLNGYLVVEYDQRLPAWQRLIANSKFADMPGFGQSRKGHIALQDHGDPVWFRNIRIREL